MIFWIATTIAGCIALWLDLGNRLFGSYARTRWGASWRIVVVTIICLLQVFPLLLVLHGFQMPLWRGLLVLTGLVGIGASAHFIWPYRFGITRLRSPQVCGTVTELAAGIVLRRITMPFSSLPCDQLRLLILSDQHANDAATVAVLRSALEALGNTPADLVLLLGDFGENPDCLPDCVALSASMPSRWGTYCVLGNHDFEGRREVILKEAFKRHGVVLIEDEAIAIPAVGITLLGTHRPWIRTPAMPKPHGFTIGLSHTPDNLPAFSGVGVDVCIAGHTHGGRLSLPGIGPLLVPSRYGRVMSEGWHRHANTLLYITRGIGYRIGGQFHNGEVVELTLTRRTPIGATSTATT